MHLLVALLLVVVIPEIIAGYLSGGFQKAVALVLGLIIALLASVLVGIRPSPWTVILLYISIFRIVNLIKLVDSQKQLEYLHSSFLRTSLTLVIYQVIVICFAWIVNASKISYQHWWAIVVGLSLFGAIVVLFTLKRGLSKTRPALANKVNLDIELPSITVAIPARNETVDLEECLNSLIGSDYPKMEILVLDDCSQEARTPEIIRSYANSGVKFLQGTVPNEAWTAKNYAYQQLAQAANGEIIFFCGVDVRFDRQTLRNMVQIKLSKNKKMISFMPLNKISSFDLRASLLQPVRYLWELAIPRRFLNRPPVLSSCWLIDKNELVSSGGFMAVSRSIVPERYFAKNAIAHGDGYSFICLGRVLGLYSFKSFDGQLSTAIRTKYPLTSQRIENVVLLNSLEFLVFLAPIGLLVYEIFQKDLLLSVLSCLSILIVGLSIFAITRLAYGKSLPLSFILYPFTISMDIYLNLYSMYKYEFSEVSWKGRNVCIPVMRLIPKNQAPI